MTLNELILKFDPEMPRTVQLARMGNKRAIAKLYEHAAKLINASEATSRPAKS